MTVHCRIRPPAREDAGERIEWQYNPSQIMEDTKMGKKPVMIPQRTFCRLKARRCTAMAWIFIPAYCFAIP